jgi:hsp70-interacting protein
MSKEDVEFLEKVMKEGIIDEGERMKEILRRLTEGVEAVLNESVFGREEEKRKDISEDDMLDMFQELRDIVEQIDYARAFMAMGGITFLLGCATTEGSVPKSIRKSALSVLATMCQNNPPVQLNLMQEGHMPQLIKLFFDYSPTGKNGDVGDDSIREKVVQTLSASIRGHAMAEHVFCQNEQGKTMLRLGLGMPQIPDLASTMAEESWSKPSVQLRKRSLFLLKALLTADEVKSERIMQHECLLNFVCTHEINPEWEEEAEIREMGLEMLTEIIARHLVSAGVESNVSPAAGTIIAQHKNCIASVGVKRINAIKCLEESSEEREYAMLELEAWEQLMVALSKIDETLHDNQNCQGDDRNAPVLY